MNKNYLGQLIKYSTAFTSLMILIVSIAFVAVNHISDLAELNVIEGYLAFIAVCWIITTAILAWLSEADTDG